MAETIEQPTQPHGSVTTTTTGAGIKPAPTPAERPKTLPPWNVILLDDNEHTYDYVIEMLINLFGHSLQRSLRLARGVDRDGRGVIFTAHRELAELKREQIRAFGVDPRVMRCRGSMMAIIEPADA